MSQKLLLKYPEGETSVGHSRKPTKRKLHVCNNMNGKQTNTKKSSKISDHGETANVYFDLDCPTTTSGQSVLTSSLVNSMLRLASSFSISPQNGLISASSFSTYTHTHTQL